MELSEITNKMNSIQIDPEAQTNLSTETTGLSVEDIQFIDERDQAFKETQESLKHNLSMLLECDKKNPLDPFEYHNYGDGSITTRRSSDILWNERYLFTFKKDIVLIRELALDLKKSYLTVILNYFNDKYNLKLNPADFDDLKLKISRENIIDFISEKTGGFLFEDSGFSFLFETFKKYFYSRNAPKLNSNKITFQDFVYYEHYIKEHSISSYGSSSEKYNVLVKTLVYYFRNSFDLNPDINFFPFSKTIDYSDIYPFPNFENFEGMKFFKNGRLDLIFKTPGSAAEYFNLFELSTIIEN